MAFDAKAFLAVVSDAPGVYRMRDERGEVIYVGKAKSLKKRLASYFRSDLDNAKTRALVAHIASIDVTVTPSEAQALVLENNLIKQHRPKYNVLLRDDKSYPYLLLSAHRHPRLAYHRGPKKDKGEYFGPFPSGGAVRESMRILQKLFAVRQCEDSYYRARSRPCLEYQLGRCTAPCVNQVSEAAYQQQVERTRLFLKGRSNEVVALLVADMEQAAASLQFERAAQLRDQIAALRHVQQQHSVEGGQYALDAIGLARAHGITVVQLLMVRDGKLVGSRALYPKVPADTEDGELLTAVVSQQYADLAGALQLPDEILLPAVGLDLAELGEALGQLLGNRLHLVDQPRGDRRRFLELAATNADTALASHLAHRHQIGKRFAALQDRLGLDQMPERIECFDISHTMGELTVASCVVFTPAGAAKSDYRRYNIEGITGGDDYAAMAQALSRRFRQRDDDSKLPDVLLIDGGLGQLARAEEILDALEWAPTVKRPLLIGVAKGETRKPGLETLVMGGSHDMITLRPDDSALLLIQQVRDEAHRFAISGHRARRHKARTTSPLEGIAGIGPKRRQQLLTQLGGWQQVQQATVEELMRVPGISRQLAETIVAALKGR